MKDGVMANELPSILCVDDDTEVLELLKEHLSLKGFIVLTATNGVEACLQVKRWAPRAVVLDLFVPRLGGLGTLTRIRSMSPDVVIVLLSDVPGALDLVVSAGLNVSAALTKPVDPEQRGGHPTRRSLPGAIGSTGGHARDAGG
jgi:CheY-like chemotaxis protein